MSAAEHASELARKAAEKNRRGVQSGDAKVVEQHTLPDAPPLPETPPPTTEVDIPNPSSLAPAQITPKQMIADTLERNKQALALSLPSGMNPERFARLLLTAANLNPELFECDRLSFLAAGITCAQLGLEPNDPRGLAYLIPFRDSRKGKVVNLILGYRGMLELARRSGLVSSIHAFCVYEGDTFRYELGLHPTLEHIPAPDSTEDPGKITHVYAVATVMGDPQFVVLSRRMVDRARAQSRGNESHYSPWHTNYPEMAAKTALRRLCKMLPQTVELATAIAVEEPGDQADRLRSGAAFGIELPPEMARIANEPDDSEGGDHD